ncbi:hypothetical protein HPP92_002391 [Vanilla planifolia]|uniref:SHSP domain-containing protein n=1 Tax=Vanilla planifolia TaxID=51239 RepID=A0A835RZV8_VANPL|nr:hypothetical protein HPP92_002391 [Vanilla planifolia]
MSFLTDSLLLDSRPSPIFLHFPEELELFAALPPSRTTAGRRNLHSSSVARSDGGRTKGTGSVPVDILETPKNYAFFLDVPGLPKSEIQKVSTSDDANTSAITAKYEDGVLTVLVEKLSPTPEPKTKTVEVPVA